MTAKTHGPSLVSFRLPINFTAWFKTSDAEDIGRLIEELTLELPHWVEEKTESLADALHQAMVEDFSVWHVQAGEVEVEFDRALTAQDIGAACEGNNNSSSEVRE